jgi:hypothetical protein
MRNPLYPVLRKNRYTRFERATEDTESILFIVRKEPVNSNIDVAALRILKRFFLRSR